MSGNLRKLPAVRGKLGGGAMKLLKPLKALDPADDPLADHQPSGDLEADSKEQLSAVQEGFRKRKEQEAERFANATGSDFYCCLVFDSGEQCDIFLRAVGVGLRDSDLFVDGRKVAARLGIELPAAPAFGKLREPDAKLKALARKA